MMKAKELKTKISHTHSLILYRALTVSRSCSVSLPPPSLFCSVSLSLCLALTVSCSQSRCVSLPHPSLPHCLAQSRCVCLATILPLLPSALVGCFSMLGCVAVPLAIIACRALFNYCLDAPDESAMEDTEAEALIELLSGQYTGTKSILSQ